MTINSIDVKSVWPCTEAKKMTTPYKKEEEKEEEEEQENLYKAQLASLMQRFRYLIRHIPGTANTLVSQNTLNSYYLGHMETDKLFNISNSVTVLIFPI